MPLEVVGATATTMATAATETGPDVPALVHAHPTLPAPPGVPVSSYLPSQILSTRIAGRRTRSWLSPHCCWAQRSLSASTVK